MVMDQRIIVNNNYIIVRAVIMSCCVVYIRGHWFDKIGKKPPNEDAFFDALGKAYKHD